MRLPSPRIALLAAAACLAVAAPAAHADSIAYVKDGNVWLATPDGARQFQVTSSGAYADVSQADDGTMIALTGVRLHKLDRMGKVLADFDTPVSDTRPAPAKTFYGPFDPAISPDGTKVAYTYYYMTQSQSPTCYPPTCFVGINEGGTGYSHSDRQTAWDEEGFRKHSGWRNPIWVDDQVTLLSNPTHLPNADVVVDEHAKRGTNGWMAQNWFTDTTDGNQGVNGGDVSRDRLKLAYVTGGVTDSTLTVYSVPKFPTSFRDGVAPTDTLPQACYRYSGPNGGKYASPTFSPDGARIAWSEGDGVHVASVPAFGGGCTLDGATATPPLVIPGASQPDWGPADVPAARPAPPTPGPDVKPGNAGAAKVRATRARLRAALAKGLKVRVMGAPTGRLPIVVKRGRTVVGRTTVTVGSGGRATATVRFTKSARRTLRGMRRVTLTISAAGASTKLTLQR